MGGLGGPTPGQVGYVGLLACWNHRTRQIMCSTDFAFFQDNSNLIDNSETVYISSLALLKMLRHGRAGVPMEVMGLMLGEFVDDFTVKVMDVFAMNSALMVCPS